MPGDTNKETSAPQVTLTDSERERLRHFFANYTPPGPDPQPELAYTPDANLHGKKCWSYREGIERGLTLEPNL